MTYNRKRIAWELMHTAQGNAYYGNALRVSKDLPELDDQDRSLLDKWATGRNSGLSDRTDLQRIANKIWDVKE